MLRLSEMHQSDASIWIGKEAEYEDEEKLKLFVDGASVPEIESALGEYETAEELHFAHEVRWSVVRHFAHTMPITVEIEVGEVPPAELLAAPGITFILRAPMYIEKVKQCEGDYISVIDLTEAPTETTEWQGKKIYSQDQVIK